MRYTFLFCLLIFPFGNSFAQKKDLIVAANDTLLVKENKLLEKFEMEDNSILYVSSTLDTIFFDTNRFLFGKNCQIKILGKNGTNGDAGRGYGSARECDHGKHGGNGERGAIGEKPPVLVLKGSIIRIGDLTIDSIGGNGGNGGNGGKGERGGNADDDTFDCSCGPGNGGNGGNGGNAGEGGKGSDVLFYYDIQDDLAVQLLEKIEYTSVSGKSGTPGKPGEGGLEGPAKGWCKPDGIDGKAGKPGQIISSNARNGRIKFIRFYNQPCSDFLDTHAFIISAYENENDAFFKAKNDFIDSLNENLSNIYVHDFKNLNQQEIISLFDRLKDGTIDDIDDPESTQVLICFIGHGRYDDISSSLYFISQPISEKILMDDVISRIEKSVFKNKLTIINSCSSGGILDNYPFTNTVLKPFFPSTLDKIHQEYACWGNSSKYFTSSYDKEKSSKTDFIYGIINQINSFEKILTANQIFRAIMGSEHRMDGVRPVIAKPDYSESESSFLFIKS